MTRQQRPVENRVYTAFHLFCGIGGGSLGFSAGRAELGHLRGRVVNIGGVDSDERAIRDYRRLTRSDGSVVDLFTRDDYADFHGKPPPPGWREATPDDIFEAAGRKHPTFVFLSPPCKSFSGLLPKARTKEAKYKALSRLVTRGLFLAMEAFSAHPPAAIILENVPGIEVRGAGLIDQNVALLQSYGYAVQTTRHDCGDIGNTGSHRWRFLFIARHVPSVAPFIYEPPRRGLKSLGDVILKLPLPFDPAGGPMHRLPKLEFKTWLRLALIPPGGDWRDLAEWAPDTFAVDRTPFNNVFRVLRASEPAPTVTAGATPTSGGYAVPDVRLSESRIRHPAQVAVADPDRPARTVTGSRLGSGGIAAPDVRMSLPDNSVTLRVRSIDRPAATIPGRSGVWDSGGQAVPDPRVSGNYRNGTLGVGSLDEPAAAVTASADIWSPGQGATPEPRVTRAFRGSYGVCDLDEPTGAVTGSARESTGAFSVPDVRVGSAHNGSYGIADPANPSGVVTGGAAVSTGRFSAPDARVLSVRPDFWPDDLPIIISPHTGCMHRPLTTLELWALMGFCDVLGFDSDSPPWLDGKSVSRWRTAIGNAVPPPAAKAIAEVLIRTMLANELAQQPLPTTPVWVDQRMPIINRVFRAYAPDEYGAMP